MALFRSYHVGLNRSVSLLTTLQFLDVLDMVAAKKKRPLAEVVRGPRYSTGIGLLMAAHEQQKRRDLAKLSTGSVQQVA